jgi:enoyl-CoA hydratase/carnithine racemase
MTTVLLETDGPLATVTLNRPHVLNAFDMSMLEDFEIAFETLSRLPALRVVVIRGAGRAFSSGLDLNMRADGVPLDFFERQERLRLRLEALSAISIAFVHGYCLGGGLQLAIACDIRVATEDARFGLPAVMEGIFPGLATVRLPRLIGLGPARKLVLSGEQIDAREALRLGLIDHLSSDIDGVIQTYLRTPPTAAAASKYLLRAAFERPLDALVEEERNLFAACLASSDNATAIDAWSQRRAAKLDLLSA